MSGCVSGNEAPVGSEGDLLAPQEVLLSLLVCVHTCGRHPPLASPHIRSRVSSLASLAATMRPAATTGPKPSDLTSAAGLMFDAYLTQELI